MVKRIRDHRRLFFSQLASLIDEATDANFPRLFASFLGEWVPAQEIVLFEFRKGLQPLVIFASGGEKIDADLRKYLSGLYLFDPFFETFQNTDKRGVLHISQDSIENFNQSRFYQRYFRSLSAKNEVGSLLDVGQDICVHVSILIDDASTDQLERVVNVMGDIDHVCTSLFKMHYGSGPQGEIDEIELRRSVHAQIVKSLMSFGSRELTQREKEIARFLLRGHSAKSMARLLDISPGTIGIHRSNIYKKMNVSSQAELSSLFLERLLHGGWAQSLAE